jgi:Kef-type K+ transport system membrane component KefB
MIESALPSLVLIAAAAVLAPIISHQTRGLRVPTVVIELGLGILIGPYVLKLVHPNSLVSALSDMGLTFLMFLAGYELDLNRVKGQPLRLATLGWLISLALALGLAFALVSSGLALDTLIVGLSLTTTALGTLLPVLGDSGVLPTKFGAYVLGIGTVGEFGPVVMVAVLLTHKDPRISGSLLVAFVAVATLTALLATRAHPPKVVAFLRRHLNSSAQLPVRVALLLVLLLVFLAFKLGLDELLGAFAAGIVVRLFTMGEDSKAVESKLQAIGFGFLVPIFFIVSGVHFDLHILLHRPSALLRLVLFLALMLVVRGGPTLLLYRRVVSRAERLPLALFSATGLPLIVVITTIGTSEGRILPENAAALVGAGMLSVLLFPLIGLRRLRAATAAGDSTGEPKVEEDEERAAE